MTYRDYVRYFNLVYIRLKDFNYNIVRWFRYNNMQFKLEKEIVLNMYDLMSEELDNNVCLQCQDVLIFDSEHSELWWCKRCNTAYEPWEIEKGIDIYD